MLYSTCLCSPSTAAICRPRWPIGWCSHRRPASTISASSGGVVRLPCLSSGRLLLPLDNLLGVDVDGDTGPYGSAKRGDVEARSFSQLLSLNLDNFRYCFQRLYLTPDEPP